MDVAFFYFSGTGNSRFISNQFAQKMKNNYNWDIEVHSIEEVCDYNKIIKNNSIIGFCFPVYGSNVPKIMRLFVERYKELLGNKKIIIFSTQLMFSGDGSRVFTDLIKDIPVEVILAEHFNMPNNLCNVTIFKIKNGEENKKKLLKAQKRLEKVCVLLADNKKHLRGFNFISKFLGLTQRIPFKKMEKAAEDKVFIDKKTCSLCGLCVRECPMSNLSNEDNIIVAKGMCTLCYRCINHCPNKSINVWMKTKIKKQYKGIIVNR